MRFLLIGLMLSLIVKDVCAQLKDGFTTPDQTDSIQYQSDDFLLKFDIAALAGQSVLIAGEHFLKPSRLSINTDLAVLFRSENYEFDDLSDHDFFGFFVRPQLRYYYKPSRSGLERWYFGLSARYKMVQTNGDQAVGVGCDEFDNCDYIQFYSGIARTHRFDLQLHYGDQLRVYDDLYLEVDLGYGYGYEFQDLNGFDGRLYASSSHINSNRMGWGVNGSVGARIIYVIDGKHKQKIPTQ